MASRCARMIRRHAPWRRLGGIGDTAACSAGAFRPQCSRCHIAARLCNLSSVSPRRYSRLRRLHKPRGTRPTVPPVLCRQRMPVSYAIRSRGRLAGSHRERDRVRRAIVPTDLVRRQGVQLPGGRCVRARPAWSVVSARCPTWSVAPRTGRARQIAEADTGSDGQVGDIVTYTTSAPPCEDAEVSIWGEDPQETASRMIGTTQSLMLVAYMSSPPTRFPRATHGLGGIGGLGSAVAARADPDDAATPINARGQPDQVGQSLGSPGSGAETRQTGPRPGPWIRFLDDEQPPRRHRASRLPGTGSVGAPGPPARFGGMRGTRRVPIALGAGLVASSIALIGFGVD